MNKYLVCPVNMHGVTPLLKLQPLKLEACLVVLLQYVSLALPTTKCIVILESKRNSKNHACPICSDFVSFLFVFFASLAQYTVGRNLTHPLPRNFEKNTSSFDLHVRTSYVPIANELPLKQTPNASENRTNRPVTRYNI